MLVKILLSNDQINLLAFENSNLICKNYGNKFWENFRIEKDKDGIKERSVASESRYDQKSEEFLIDIGHNDLLNYLSQQQNNQFQESINKLVTEFDAQQMTAQKMKILKYGFGIVEDSIKDNISESHLNNGDHNSLPQTISIPIVQTNPNIQTNSSFTKFYQ